MPRRKLNKDKEIKPKEQRTRSTKDKTVKDQTVKNVGGRPTKYKPEHDEQVVKLCRLGATDKEIADFFNVTESTVNLWKLKEPSFSESVKEGKLIADMNVANALYKKATGYSQEDVEIFQFQGEPVIVPVIKNYQPDTGAAMAWLKNRRPKDFRDKHDLEVSGELNVIKVTPPKFDEE